MIDKLLQVLNIKRMNTKLHAERTKEIYHREIVNHKPCEKCHEGMIYVYRLNHTLKL